MCRYTIAAATLVLLMLLGCSSGTKVSDWPELGVRIDKIGITKTLIGNCCFRGNVRNIQLGNFDNDSDLELAIVPQTGIYLFDAASLKKKAKIDFKKADGDTLWLGLSPYLIPNQSGFSIAMLGGGFGDIGLLDQSGKELWKFKSNPSLPPNGMVVDDTHGQEPHFYVCDSGAIYRLDAAGAVVWKVAESADYIALIRDQDTAGAGFATAKHRSRTLSIWSASGKRIQQIELPFYPNELAFVRMGAISGFVVRSDAQVAFFDHSGTHRFSYTYDAVPVLHGPSAVLVQIVAEQPPLLALRSASRSATGKSVLTLLSLDGSLVYEEYLGGGSALGVAPIKEEFRDRLIVGEGTDKLWIYEQTSHNKKYLTTKSAPR